VQVDVNDIARIASDDVLDHKVGQIPSGGFGCECHRQREKKEQ